MGRKRLIIDMSYGTPEPEGVGHSINFRKNSGLKFRHKKDGEGGDEDEAEDDKHRNNHQNHLSRLKDFSEAEDDDETAPDTWSIKHGPRSGSKFDQNSAKFTTYKNNNRKHHDDQPTHNNSHQRHYNHYPWNSQSQDHDHDCDRRGGFKTDTGASTTDEEFSHNCVTNMSSASSSISWAEDAVEAELTQKIFSLWEDVQSVVTGEIVEKPSDMTDQVFEECLNWKRAFPVQNLDRFSRYSEDDALTPTVEDRLNLSLQSLLNYKSTSPDSPNTSAACLTPNPEKNSHYVALWLSDCQQNQVAAGAAVTADDAEPPPSLTEDDLKSISISQEEEDNESLSPNNFENNNLLLLRSTSSASTPTSNNMTCRRQFEPDPNNFFTSLALNNPSSLATRNDTTGTTFNRFSSATAAPSGGGGGRSRRRKTNNTQSSALRVQRPISSNVKGHLITPLSTKHASSASSRSFRETSRVGGGGGGGGWQAVFDDHAEDDENDDEDEDDDQVFINNDSNSSSDRTSYNFGPIPNRLTIPKGRTAPVFPVCPPVTVTPSHCRSSSGPRRLQSRAGGYPNNSSDINGGGGNYGQFSYNNSVHQRREPSTTGGHHHHGGGGGGASNSRSSAVAAMDNGFGNGAGLLPGSNWSRHSSITESFSFKVTSGGGGGGCEDGGDASTLTTTVTTQEGHYFETVCQNFEPQTRRGLSRPHFLPLRSKDADNIQPPKQNKPVRPFLYWLLDKVSPS